MLEGLAGKTVISKAASILLVGVRTEDAFALALEQLGRYAILGALMEHEAWMREAIAEARLAQAAGDVPVGAVVVYQGQIVGRGRNCREAQADPTAHAELLALREAAHTLGAWRLGGAVLYCTLEPCCMCAGALVNARVETLVFGVRDAKTGAAGSVYDLVRSPWLNHRLKVVSGVLASEIEELMRSFFAQLRAGASGA